MRYATRAHRIGFGLLAVVLVGALGSLGILAANGAYSSDYTLTAVFDRSGQGLDESSTVKMRGVTIGSVAGIRLLPDGRAEVTLHLHDGVQVPDTVIASAQPLSVFGPKFIALTPGDHELTGPYLTDGDTILDTSEPTEITDLLVTAAAVLDAVDPEDLHAIIDTLAHASDGLGDELGDTIDSTGVLTQLLADRDADTQQLLINLAAIAEILADRGPTITGIGEDLRAVLPEITGRGDELGQLLAATSGLSRQLAGLVSDHREGLGALIDGLSPTVQVLTDQLACVPGFLAATSELVGVLGPSLLTYEFEPGRLAAVATGPLSLQELLTPLPTRQEPPVPRCGTGAGS